MGVCTGKEKAASAARGAGCWHIILLLALLLGGCQGVPHQGIRLPLQAAPDAGGALDAQQAQGGVAQDIWALMRQGVSLPPLQGEAADEVAQQIRQFAASRWLERVAQRAAHHLPLYVQAVAARKLPMELALVPFVESALEPLATSPKGAHGPWQFMAPTAQERGLVVNHLVDQRRDMLLATGAALDHLVRLQEMFGDWQLALAAYNCGEGCVGRALQRNRVAGLPGSFEHLGLPGETRQYVVRIMALQQMVAEPYRFGVGLPVLPVRPELVRVQLPMDVDVDVLVARLGLPQAVLARHNPAVQGPLVVARWVPELLLPPAAALRWYQDGDELPLPSWQLVRLREARPVGDLAAVAKVSGKQLARLNRIPSGLRPREGSVLLLPRMARLPAFLEPFQPQAHLAGLRLEADLVPVKVTVRKGETLARVAQRLGVAINDLARWNRLKPKARLSKGQVLLAYVPREVGRG